MVCLCICVYIDNLETIFGYKFKEDSSYKLCMASYFQKLWKWSPYIILHKMQDDIQTERNKVFTVMDYNIERLF